MAIHATNVIAPVLTTAKVIVFFLARVTTKTRFGSLFRSFVFERDDLGRIAFSYVRFAWTMTRFATGRFVFPATDLCELSV